MKAIRSEYVHMHIMKKVYKVFVLLVLTFTLVLTIPGEYHRVYAAQLEDCDLDGFDDATGVPVPWPGYDETKGDTPDGPGGGKATTEPSSSNSPTTDNTNSEKPSKSSEDSDKTNNVKSGENDNTKSNKKNSTKTENNHSGKSSNKGKVESDNTNSRVQDNTNKVESDKTSSITSSNTNGTDSDKTSSSVSSEEYNRDNTVQSEEEQAEENTGNGDNVNTDISADEIELIINTKGSLKITETTGSIIHAGSSVIISGTGFVGDTHNLEIEIHSEPRQLGVVESSKNGSFEAQVNIPKDLEAGVHNIVVLYQGNEITSQKIEIGPKAADSFLQALSVGFTKDNIGLIPGILILLGLFVLGVGILIVKKLQTTYIKHIDKV